MKNWKKSDLIVRGILPKPPTKKKQTKTKLPKGDPEGLAFIKNHLSILKIPYETETKFHSKRKFRFDISITRLKLAIEYEGLVSSKSRHTTIKGYTNDTEKYNLCQIEGWIVLRYTVLNFKNFTEDLDFVLKNITVFEERSFLIQKHNIVYNNSKKTKP